MTTASPVKKPTSFHKRCLCALEKWMAVVTTKKIHPLKKSLQ
jgi:hypothetical protein